MRSKQLVDTSVIVVHSSVSGIAGLLLRLLPVCLLCGLATAATAQISYGGKPMAPDAEIRSTLRAAVDYFIEMPFIDTDSIIAADVSKRNRIGGLRFAHTFFTDLTPENSGVTFYTEDGTRVWKVGIRSRGAYSLNVLFSEFLLPDNAKVFLYNSDRSSMLGAFTSKNRPKGGEFSVAPVEGDELTIEYHEPADAPFNGNLRITEINHDYLGIFKIRTRFNLLDMPCLPDVTCDSTYDTVSRSVCLLIVNGSSFSTGTLVNNTALDGRPYLLTAAHSLSNNALLGSRVVVFMNYKSPRCDKRIRGSEEFSISGSVTRALSNEVDFALLELSELPPADFRPYLAGWSTDTLTTVLPYTGLHHPYGEVMKYCIEEDTIAKTNWVSETQGIARGNHWLINHWDIGHTWSGSSGSPLFDNRFRVVGALTGGDSGGEFGCDSVYVGDFYYRFYRAWDQFPDSTKQLKHWLDPGSTDSITRIIRLDGMDPYAENPARRITNILPVDTMGAVSADAPGRGSLFGQNSFGTSSYAEHFVTTDSSMIQGVYLMVAKGTFNGDNPVTVSVFEGGEKPGKTLTKAVLNPHYINYSNGRFSRETKATLSNCENYLRFDGPISVGTDFYVGYQVPYPIESISDTFYVYAALRDSQTIYNTAYYKSNLLWHPFTEHVYKPLNTSLWIEPVILNNTITEPDTSDYTEDDSVRIYEPVVFYDEQESLLYFRFSKDWTEETQVEMIDLFGRCVNKMTVMPPLASYYFKPMKRQLYLIRLTSREKRLTVKLMVR